MSKSLRNDKDPKACRFGDVTHDPISAEKLSEYGREATFSCHGLPNSQTAENLGASN
jgi:hypothetical protein